MLALGTVLVVVVAVTVAWVFSARPQPLTVAQDAPTPSAGSSAGTTSSGTTSSDTTPSRVAPAGEVVVDVEGKVRRPGLYRLEPGARVNDALKAAGGVLPGVSAVGVNRAAKLTDGQQIVVSLTPVPAAQGAPGAGSGGVGPASAADSAASGGVLSLNSADLTQLQGLPGVGPVLAQHILDWRTAHGGFARIDQLQDVNGIGPSKYAAIKDLVTP